MNHHAVSSNNVDYGMRGAVNVDGRSNGADGFDKTRKISVLY